MNPPARCRTSDRNSRTVCDLPDGRLVAVPRALYARIPQRIQWFGAPPVLVGFWERYFDSDVIRASTTSTRRADVA